MKTNTNHPQKTQSISRLPLFSWPAVVVQPNTRIGQFVARRYHVDPAVADLIADLAGLRLEASPYDPGAKVTGAVQ